MYGRIVSLREDGGRQSAGVEFTSTGAETERKLHLYVHKRLQGECTEDLVPLPA